MKKLQKKWAIFLIFCIALFAFSIVGYAKTADNGESEAKQFEYAINENTKIHVQTINEQNYLFLPSSETSFDIRKLDCGDLKPVLSQSEQEDGKEKMQIELVEESAGSESGGIPFTLYVMHSQNLSTMYLTSKDEEKAGRTWVDASKENLAKGSMVFQNASGEKTIYDGALSQIKARGNSTFTYYPKKSYQIKLDKKTSLVKGTEKGKTWVLLAAYTDPTKMVDQLWKEASTVVGDKYAAKEETIDLYYDGEYRGTYMLSEKNQINGNRIDITDMEEAYELVNPSGYGKSENMVKKKATNKYKMPYYYSKQVVNGQQQDIVEPEKQGGFLVELNGTSGDEQSWFKTDNGLAYNVKSPEFTGQQSMKYISEYMEEFTQAIQAQNKKGEYTGVNPTTGKHYYEYCDLDSLARLYLLNAVSGNSDGLWHSLYFYKDVNDIMYAGPIWDMELTLGTGWVDDIPAEQDLMAGTTMGRYLIQIPSFQKKVKELYERDFVSVEQALLGEGTIIPSIEDRAKKVEASIAMDNVLWPSNLRSGSPYAGYPSKSYQEYVNNNKTDKYVLWDADMTVQDIVNWRIAWMRQHKEYLDTTYAALNPGEDGEQELIPADDKPAQDNTKPAQDNTKPAQDNTKPAQDNTKPTQDNTKPAKNNTKPASDKNKQNSTTQNKSTTTKAKEETTGTGTSKPVQAVVKVDAGNIQISWNKIANAKKYEVYVAKCGTSYKKGIKTTTKKLSAKISLKKLKKFNLKSGSWKVKVKAYTYVKGKKKVLVTEKDLHFVLRTSSQYTNVKKISVNKTQLKLKKGGTYKIKAEIIKERKGKKLLPQTHCKKLRWKSSNPGIATVKNGKITAKQKGVCKIYVIAANGVKKTIKVTVN